MSLLTGTVTLHDVADLEAHLRTDLDVQLKARGGFLTGYEYEDALTYFIGKGWELSLVYDSERGWSFSKLLRDRSYYWLTDFYRQRYDDTRYHSWSKHKLDKETRTCLICELPKEDWEDSFCDLACKLCGAERSEAEIVRCIPIMPELLADEDRPFLHVEWPEVLATINIALLSPIAARAHDQIAVPHYVQGAPLVDISVVLKTPRSVVKQRLDLWKEEVRIKCLAA